MGKGGAEFLSQPQACSVQNKQESYTDFCRLQNISDKKQVSELNFSAATGN